MTSEDLFEKLGEILKPQTDANTVLAAGWIPVEQLPTGKKNIEIDVKELETKDGWIGTCRSEFGFVKYGDTHIQVVDRMRTELAKRGYEVGNLPEVMGIA